jgi:hypothetical protein
MTVRLSAFRAGCPFIPQEDSWYPFLLEAESTLRAMVQLEGLGQLKNPMTSSGLDSAYSVVPQPTVLLKINSSIHFRNMYECSSHSVHDGTHTGKLVEVKKLKPSIKSPGIYGFRKELLCTLCVLGI